MWKTQGPKATDTTPEPQPRPVARVTLSRTPVDIATELIHSVIGRKEMRMYVLRTQIDALKTTAPLLEENGGTGVEDQLSPTTVK